MITGVILANSRWEEERQKGEWMMKVNKRYLTILFF